MAEKQIDLPHSWLNHLENEFSQPYMQQLKQFLLAEKQNGKVIYPPANLWFNALKTTDFDAVKVVILGQDPYHGEGQAHGLSFSVPPGVKIPPSLRNIYKEQEDDLGIVQPNNGTLLRWAEQGVLLLNATLTVQAQLAGSHQGKGWEQFTDAIISALNQHRNNIVFMLWGSYAQRKGQAINSQRHLVLKAPHPSPLSAHRGFLGCKHFSKTNQYLTETGQEAIDWQL